MISPSQAMLDAVMVYCNVLPGKISAYHALVASKTVQLPQMLRDQMHADLEALLDTFHGPKS